MDAILEIGWMVAGLLCFCFIIGCAMTLMGWA
jgi:hypothetical protein